MTDFSDEYQCAYCLQWLPISEFAGGICPNCDSYNEELDDEN